MSAGPRYLAVLLLSGLTLVPVSAQEPTNKTAPTSPMNATMPPATLATTRLSNFMTLTEVVIKRSKTNSEIGLKDGLVEAVTFDYNITYRNVTRYRKKGWKILVSINEDTVASIGNSSVIYIPENRPSGTFTVEMKGEAAGRSTVTFKVGDWFDGPSHSQIGYRESLLDSDVIADVQFELYVMRTQDWTNHLFNIVILLLVLTTNIGMGIKVDLSVVKDSLRKPIGASIGMFSQLIMMPLIAYGTVRLMHVSPGLSLGLFVSGCAPGGLASNIFTYLLGGNISLSITMTLLSTLASTVMIPFWLYTLGATLFDTSAIKIPFLNIAGSLLVLLLPTLIGLVLQYKCIRIANYYVRALRYIMWGFLLILFTFGVYCSWWITKVTTTKILIASAALPYIGFLFGGIVSTCFWLDWPDVVTIAVETGIQNTAVPLVLINLSLPESVEKQVSIVVPLLSSTVTPIPLLLLLMYMEVKKFMVSRRYKKRLSEGGEITEPPPPIGLIERSLTKIRASTSSGKPMVDSDRQDEDNNDDRDNKAKRTKKRSTEV